jgi:hypothetical protein
MNISNDIECQQEIKQIEEEYSNAIWYQPDVTGMKIKLPMSSGDNKR